MVEPIGAPRALPKSNNSKTVGDCRARSRDEPGGPNSDMCCRWKRGAMLTSPGWTLHRPTEYKGSRRRMPGNMDLDYSWNALFRPGAATEYFDVDDPERVRTDTPEFNAANAWWIAELSRLIYRQEFDEVGARASGPRRLAILEAADLRELLFVSRGGTQCAIVESQHAAGERFGVLVFRGTSIFGDWLSNLNALPADWPEGGLVHRGFMEALDKVWGDVDNCLSAIDRPMLYTGHSLGAALATLAASRSARPPCAVYTFGSPRVGNSDFVATLRNIAVYRVVNNRDIVPNVPPSQAPLYFCHAGELCHITADNRVLVNMTGTSAAKEGEETDPSLLTAMAYPRWLYPVQFLADHAPTNYVARLERVMLQTGS